jgi:hypothetical protein
MFTIPKCFSALIASGNGSRCKELRARLMDTLLCTDKSTGIAKVIIFKTGNEEDKKIIKDISNELADSISNLYSDIDVFFFGKDLEKKSSKASNIAD